MFITITKVQAESIMTTNFTVNSHPLIISYNNILKSLKLGDLKVAELDIAKDKLNQYSRDLEKLVNEPFVSRNIS